MSQLMDHEATEHWFLLSDWDRIFELKGSAYFYRNKTSDNELWYQLE